MQLWERLAPIVIGVGVCTGALSWLGRSPITHIVLEPGRRRMQLVRLGLAGRKVEEPARRTHETHVVPCVILLNWVASQANGQPRS